MARTGRPKQEITKSKTVSLRMNEEQYERLKAYADKLGVSMTDAIMSSVEKRIDKEEKKDGKKEEKKQKKSK